MLVSRVVDCRSAIFGLRYWDMLGACMGVLSVGALGATTVSLAATALVFDATNWPLYMAANVLLAFTYALVGALLAPIFGRVGGVFIAFLLPFLDIGITQSPMLNPEPTSLSRLLPGYGGSRILLDGALTTGFDGTYLIQYDEDPYLIEGVPAPTRGTQERAGTYRASIFTGYNKLRANAYVNWSSGIHNVRWQTRFISSVNQTESNSIGLALATKTTTKIPEYWQHDLTYRAELPWDTTMTATVQHIFDEEPPFAIGTQYNYDPSSANPLGRVYAVAVKKRF